MSDRVTKAMIQAQFKRFAYMLGRDTIPYKCGPDGGRPKAQVGALFLDHNTIYGGWVVCEMVNESGGLSCLFGHTRRSAFDMHSTLGFAMDAIRFVQKGA